MPAIKCIATLLVMLSFLGCTPPPYEEELKGRTPELTKEVIDTRINDARVYEVMPESGTGEPIAWSFDYDEPKEVTVVEQEVQGDRATIVLDITTRSATYARVHRQLSGRIKTNWRLETTLALRRWEIVSTENISMKYKDLPKPSPTASSAKTNGEGVR